MDLYQQFIHISRYARWRDDLGRRETWDETVQRYIDFFDKRTEGKFTHVLNGEVRSAILNMEAMPSMRALMTAGPALDRDNLAGFNCAYVAINSKRSFAEAMYALMCFHPDTKIKTSAGDKRIADITTDDEVLSFDEATKSYAFIRPVKTHRNDVSAKRKMMLIFEEGEEVTVTEDHLFLTTNRGWVEAKDLESSDDIVSF